MVCKTGTFCPFPYTTSSGIDLQNNPAITQNITQEMIAQLCTVSYGQALGVGFLVLHICMVFASLVGMVLIGIQTIRLRAYCLGKGKNAWWEHQTFHHYFFVFWFCVFWFLGSVDLFGFWGYMPEDAYAVFDEVTASCCISNAVLTVRFLYAVAKGARPDGNSSSNCRQLFTTTTICFIWLNFVGFAILQVVDSDIYQLYEAMKSFGGALILIVFAVSSTYYAVKVRKFMEHSSRMTQGNVNDVEGQMIKILKKKHTRLLIVVCLATLAFIANGALTLDTDDYSWTIRLVDLPDPTQVAFRILYVIYLVLSLYIFQVPSAANDANSATPSKTTTKSRKTTITVRKPSILPLERILTTEETSSIEMASAVQSPPPISDDAPSVAEPASVLERAEAEPASVLERPS